MKGPFAHFARAVRRSYEPGVDDPWWYDNAGHFLAGVLIGSLSVAVAGLDLTGTVLVFIACAAVWEYFEWRYNIRPWDSRENWSFDRAVEDTMLDTYMGLTGTVLAVFLLM